MRNLARPFPAAAWIVALTYSCLGSGCGNLKALPEPPARQARVPDPGPQPTVAPFKPVPKPTPTVSPRPTPSPTKPPKRLDPVDEEDEYGGFPFPSR